jgi:RimJ/RimL family protein N-acetyltransferase
LKYRLLESSDLDQLHRLHSIPEVDQYNALGIPKNIEDTEQVINLMVSDNKNNKELAPKSYAVQLNTNDFIGVFGIKFSNRKYNKGELWFKFDPEFWNHGYATEALTYFVKICFAEHKLHRLEAGCAINNLGSKRVLEKCGFVQEGIQRQNLPLKSGWSDNFEFGLLREEWKNKH